MTTRLFRLDWVLIPILAFSSMIAFQQADAARGRPYINAQRRTFVADNGQLLRGPLTGTEDGGLPTLAAVQSIKNYGCNALHLYAEHPDGGYAAGTRVAQIDTLVQWTRDEGLYLIITIGGGEANEAFITAFWNFYAARYKDETHVLYEIKNEPGIGAPYSAAVRTMEKNAYTLIRSKAPNTPILLFTYMIFQNSAGVLQDIASLGSIDWANAAVAFHGYGEGGRNATRACLNAVFNAGYPCFQTEFYQWPFGKGNFGLTDTAAMYQDIYQTGDYERLGVSWLTFIEVSNITNDAKFKNRMSNAGILWTPDYGSWPWGGRKTFGNGGEPWTTPDNLTGALHIEAENFDDGEPGQWITFNDTDPRIGVGYRPQYEVDAEASSDVGGGYNIGYVTAGEWLEYTTYVSQAGLYTLQLRVAALGGSNDIRVKFGGEDVTGTWNFTGTGGYQVWKTISKQVNLTPGQQVMRIEFLTPGTNLNWIEITPATTGLLANGTYRIVNRNSGKVMDVQNASTADGSKIIQWSYAGNINQKWVLTHRGGNQYTITSLQTGKAIDEQSYWTLSGDWINMCSLWNGVGSKNQRWIITPTSTGYYKIVSAVGGLVLEIPDGSMANGTIVDQYEYNGGAHQQWSFQPPEQTSNNVNEGTQINFDNSTGTFTFSWWGRFGRTYFIQHSDDLHQWVYVPLIEFGSDYPVQWRFTSTADKFFVRLKYTDQATGDPWNDDFDGDGFSNIDEVQQGSDPLDYYIQPSYVITPAVASLVSKH